MSALSLQERLEFARQRLEFARQYPTHLQDVSAFLSSRLRMPLGICSIVTGYLHQFPEGTIGYFLEEGAQKTQEAVERYFALHDEAATYAQPGNKMGHTAGFHLCMGLHRSQLFSLYNKSDNGPFLQGIAHIAFACIRGRQGVVDFGRTPKDASSALLPEPLRYFPAVFRLEELVCNLAFGIKVTRDPFQKFQIAHQLPDMTAGDPLPLDTKLSAEQSEKAADVAYPLAGDKSFRQLCTAHFTSDDSWQVLPFVRKIVQLHNDYKDQQQTTIEIGSGGT